MVYAASIFHLFDWGQQVKVAERVVGLFKRRKGSVVLGRQRGNSTPMEYEHRTNQGGTMFRRNEESWREMWRVVGEKTVSGTSYSFYYQQCGKSLYFSCLLAENFVQPSFLTRKILICICQGTQWDVHVKLQQDGASDKRYYAETQGFGVQPTRGDGSLYFEVTRL